MSFLAIPAIDLLNGVCVRLHQGDYSKVTTYATDPISIAKQFVSAGAKRIHIVDLNGAKLGKPVNHSAISAIIQAVRRIDSAVELQIGGGLRTLVDMNELLSLGANYVIVGSIAVDDPELFSEARSALFGKILLGIDARNGKLAVNGWTKDTSVTALEFARKTDLNGIAGIIYTDISCDGTLAGPNVEATDTLAQEVSCPVYASGGIGSLVDVDVLRTDHIAGAIIGKAIYTGNIDLRKLHPERPNSNSRSLLGFRVADSIFDIAPYQGGKTVSQMFSGQQIAEPVKLSSNENPLGCGKLAKQALADPSNHNPSMYPDGAAVQLRETIAAHLNISADMIVCGNGSNDILELCATLTLSPGRKSVFSQYAFVVYKLVTLGRGASGIEVPAKNFGNDLDAIADACCQPDVSIVFIANPNNPTGSWHPPEQIISFIHKIPRDVLIVIDEAYQEYTEDEPDLLLGLLDDFSNLIITRSFSKLHGLAGLRIGYGISKMEIPSLLNRIRQPFNANYLAQTAAIAALGDTDFITRSRQNNANGMVQLTAGLANLGYVTIPSQANFIAFYSDDAQQTYKTLLKAGIIVRQIDEYDLPNWLRATIGTPTQNERLLNALSARTAS